MTFDDFAALPLFQNILKAAPESVALAVSGGPDSMALCFMLSRWAQTYGIDLHAITVDHGLRPEAADEAAQVGLWLAEWPRVSHVTLARAPDNEAGQSRVMEEARHDRYAMLAGYCDKQHISHLFVAHHRDDQAETFLFRLAKGSGLDGLSCMAPVKPYDENLDIVRPFLEMTKDNIVALCKDADIPYIEDPSNKNVDFARPRLRKSAEILAGEGLSAKRLSVTASRMARARTALDYYAQAAFKDALAEKEDDYITFDYKVLRAAPAEIRLRVLLAALACFYPDRNYAPRMEKCEELAARIFDSAGGFKAATLGGAIFRLDGGRTCLSIAKEKAS